MTAWTDVIGWTLLHFVWQGTFIVLVTAVALRALQHASAQWRYVVACAGLLVALATAVMTPVALVGLDAAKPAPSPASAAVHGTVPSSSDSPGAPMARVAGSQPVPVDEQTVDAVLSAFVGLWAAGVLLLTTRLLVGWWRVRRLHTEALAAPASEWVTAASRIGARLGLPRVIHVVDSAIVETPTVIGWLRPVVLLPIAALANLTPDQVQAILAHELAHIRRHDFVVNLLQTIAETLLFYHPGVWWLSNRIRAEREHCCDDIAVEVCGDPVGYAEALTALAAFARLRFPGTGMSAPLAVAATGGSLLHRVQRLLRVAPESEPRRPKAPFVLALTALLIVVVGARLLVVAQAPPPEDPGTEHRLGPLDINRVLGFGLFPEPVRYATDDPRGARAWDVRVAYPGGEMSFLGFTARSLIRYAYDLEAVPVMEGPSWLDVESMDLRAETSADKPADADYREAIRVALEGQFGISIRRDTRQFPVFGLQLAAGALGPNIRPATADCIQDLRARPDVLGPSLHGRGEVRVPFCGVNHTIRGPRGLRVTLAEFARSLHGFNMTSDDEPAREVVDQTGLTGVYDFELNLGFLPLAAIATAHPTMAVGFGPMIRTFPQAMEEQLGLRLVPSQEPRDIVVIASAKQLVQNRPVEFEQQLASLRKGR